MSDIDTIRERHPLDWHKPCFGTWDNVVGRCDTRVVLDALDRADDASIDDAAALKEAVAIYDAARADANRLASALDRACTVLEMMQVGYRIDPRDRDAMQRRADEGREALRQHDGTVCDCGTVDCAKAALDSIVVGHVPPFDTTDKGERP